MMMMIVIIVKVIVIVMMTVAVTVIVIVTVIVHPVSITRFLLRRFSPGAGLLRNPFVHR